MVTGVWAESHDWSPGRVRRALGPLDVRDSKQVFSQKSPGRGEAAALAVIGALTGRVPSTARDLLEGLAMPARPAPACRDGSCRDICSPGGLELPIWADPGEIADRMSGLSRALASEGLVATGITSTIMCPWTLNSRLSGEGSKLDVDLALFLEVARRIGALRRRAGEYTCGKIGNRKAYAERIGEAPRVVRETREESAYDVPELGRLRFVLDADDLDPLVSMASLVGKYVREIVMGAIHAQGESLVPGLKRPSGYHDPATREFVERARGPLVASGALVDCIVRRR